MRAGHGALPEAEGVCEVDERTDRCACCEQEGFERHLLKVREGAVAVCTFKLWVKSVCCSKDEWLRVGPYQKKGRMAGACTCQTGRC